MRVETYMTRNYLQGSGIPEQTSNVAEIKDKQRILRILSRRTCMACIIAQEAEGRLIRSISIVVASKS
jgi:hypothetical protein